MLSTHLHNAKTQNTVFYENCEWKKPVFAPNRFWSPCRKNVHLKRKTASVRYPPPSLYRPSYCGAYVESRFKPRDIKTTLEMSTKIIHRIWNVTPCNLINRSGRFGRTCSLQLQGRRYVKLKKETACPSRLYRTKLHCVTSQKTAISTSQNAVLLFIAVAWGMNAQRPILNPYCTSNRPRLSRSNSFYTETGILVLIQSGQAPLSLQTHTII